MTEKWIVDAGFGERETTVETFCRNYPEARSLLPLIRQNLEWNQEHVLETQFGQVVIWPAA